MKYKMRAEAKNEVKEFFDKTWKRLQFFEMRILGIGYVEITFEVLPQSFPGSMSTATLLKHIGEIQDAHVMYQTLAPANEYTGERFREYTL